MARGSAASRRRGRVLPASLLLPLALRSAPIGASDHLDGPATTRHRVTDLTDLYAFPTPDRPGFLTVILDAYPAVGPQGHFSDKVDYTIHIRRATVRAGERRGFDTSDEVALRCTFVTPRDDTAHTATCGTDAGLGATVQTNRLAPRGAQDGLHLFAGRRSDPFFFNAVFATMYASKGKLLAPHHEDDIRGLNVLAIALEVEVARLFPDQTPSLLALAAESTTRDAPDAPVRRLDRIGRPETSNITTFPRDDEPDLRDPYNADPPFDVPADHAAVYRERIAGDLSFYDAIDGRTDWTDADRTALSDLLADDFLVVDVSRPCNQQGYLEIERAVLAGTEHHGCGGRKLTDDVMDTIFGLYTGGLSGPPIRDGVDSPGHRVLGEFPWLAEPDDSKPGAAKTRLANRLLRSRE